MLLFRRNLPGCRLRLVNSACAPTHLGRLTKDGIGKKQTSKTVPKRFQQGNTILLRVMRQQLRKWLDGRASTADYVGVVLVTGFLSWVFIKLVR